MARDIDTILTDMRTNPADIKFSEACKVADHFFEEFGKVRIEGSHHVYKTPWPGDPRINLQKDGSKAKRYQVVQVTEAVEKLRSIRAEAIKAAEAAKAAAEAPKVAKAAKASRKKGK